jgi:hypothetical protein
MEVQSVKAIPKCENYKTVFSKISFSSQLISKYMPLYLLCDFQILGLDCTEKMGTFQPLNKQKKLLDF